MSSNFFLVSSLTVIFRETLTRQLLSMHFSARNMTMAQGNKVMHRHIVFLDRHAAQFFDKENKAHHSKGIEIFVVHQIGIRLQGPVIRAARGFDNPLSYLRYQSVVALGGPFAASC